MTNDELRKAAELAEIRWMEIDDGVWRFVYEIAPSHYWYWYAEDPALPAFVASLLVAKVKGLDGFDAELMPTVEPRVGQYPSDGEVKWASTLWAEGGRAIITRDSTFDEGPLVAIIRAAVAALEEGE